MKKSVDFRFSRIQSESGAATTASAKPGARRRKRKLPHMNTTAHELNADQIAYWNGPAGQRWADRQAAQDILLKPVADLVVERAKLQPGERVIDIGCGSGATAIAFAREVA